MRREAFSVCDVRKRNTVRQQLTMKSKGGDSDYSSVATFEGNRFSIAGSAIINARGAATSRKHDD